MTGIVELCFSTFFHSTAYNTRPVQTARPAQELPPTSTSGTPLMEAETSHYYREFRVDQEELKSDDLTTNPAEHEMF